MRNFSGALFGAFLFSAGFAFFIASAFADASLPERERFLLALLGMTKVIIGMFLMSAGARRG